MADMWPGRGGGGWVKRQYYDPLKPLPIIANLYKSNYTIVCVSFATDIGINEMTLMFTQTLWSTCGRDSAAWSWRTLNDYLCIPHTYCQRGASLLSALVDRLGTIFVLDRWSSSGHIMSSKSVNEIDIQTLWAKLHMFIYIYICVINWLNSLLMRHSLWLTHWGRDKMGAISQTTFSYAFSWMKMFEFRIQCDWRLFLRVQLTII